MCENKEMLAHFSEITNSGPTVTLRFSPCLGFSIKSYLSVSERKK